MISSVKPVLKIAHITHTTEQTYDIISINGLPFYQSSGQQSNYPKTWFPFFGLLENSKTSFYPEGWFIKALESKLPKPIYETLMNLFPSYGSDAPGGRELLTRFWNIPCLLLSSSIGGGLWEDARGKELKAFLVKEYSDYYQQVPTFEMMPASQQIPSHIEVNQWLCKQAKITHYQDLQSQFPKTVPDLLKHLTIEAVPAPAVPSAVKKVRFASSVINPTLEGKKSASPLPAILLGLGAVAFINLGFALPVSFCFAGCLYYYRDLFCLKEDFIKPKKTVSLMKEATTGSGFTVDNVAKTFLPSVRASELVPGVNTINSPSPLKGILKRR